MASLEKRFEPFRKKMEAEKLPDVVIQNFKYYFDRLSKGETGVIPETAILPLASLPDIESLVPVELRRIGEAHLQKAVIIKLNGGLGTSMGMQDAKSLLKVKDGFSFLDITVRQAQSVHSAPPVVFMNSFSTQNSTRQALQTYTELVENNLLLDFLQHKVPKVDAHHLQPVVCPHRPDLEWCPPGHGDIYPALRSSGMLDHLLGRGYEYAFISNADNLGAVMDEVILGYFVQSSLAFMLEVADRTERDKKGGHLARLKSGRLVLREIAQTAPDDVAAFEDIERYHYFNTNNIWVHLPTLAKALLRTRGFLKLPMIRNRKPQDPRDPDSAAAYQLESAAGAAISAFPKAEALRVPRTRFMPVKTTNDLLFVRSDNFVLNDEYKLVANSKRPSKRIHIDLDPSHYRFIDDFESRFPFGVPSLVECESLQVKGDIRFGSDVTLKGCVTLQNDEHEAADIADHQTISQSCAI
jgi:UTP--glucose-1-phosphate uridylyltransferase